MTSSTAATQAWDIVLRDITDPDATKGPYAATNGSIDMANFHDAIQYLDSEPPVLRDELMFTLCPRLVVDVTGYWWTNDLATLEHSEDADKARADNLLQLAKDTDSTELQLLAVAAIAQHYGAPHDGIRAIKAVESRVLGRLQRAQELQGLTYALQHPLATLISRNLDILAPIEGP